MKSTTLKTRRFRTMVVALSLAFSFTAIAGNPPGDCPSDWDLCNPKYWDRCGNTTDVDVQKCLNLTSDTTGECLSDEQRDYARNHGVGVFCVGRVIYTACPCSCFEQDTRILTINDQGFAWKEARLIDQSTWLYSPMAEATLDDLKLAPHQISYTTSGPEDPALFVFTFVDGRTLKVTQNHALLLSDGRMIRANEVTLNDMLVDMYGLPLVITAISREHTSKHVYNLLVQTGEKAEHLLIAEGVVVGDLLWQNALDAEIGQILLRQ